MTKTRRRFGDRSDGRKLRSLAPIEALSPYIMIARNDAVTYISDKIETAEVDKYVRDKRSSGLSHFGILHVFLAGYVRVVSQKPRINRFISGQKIFARNRIEVNMVVRKTLDENEPETVLKVFFEPTDTAADVYNRFEEAFNKTFEGKENDIDEAARVLNYIPGLVKKFAVWFLKTLDYFGILPASVLRVSPFHGSMFITSLGSLGIPPVFHHLYNIGNVPMFVAFGAKRYETQIDDQGQVVRKKYIDYTVVTDERICDGLYYAAVLKLFRNIVAKPSVLDIPPAQVVEDID